MPRPDRVVFRLPPVSLFIPLLVLVLVTPLATAGSSWFRALFLLPAIALAYILLTATIADGRQIRTTGLRGGRKFTWAELNGFEFHGQRWATAVGLDGSRVRLPMVRPRDLPRLAAVSGGRLTLGPDADPEEGPVGSDVENQTGEPAGDVVRSRATGDIELARTAGASGVRSPVAESPEAKAAGGCDDKF